MNFMYGNTEENNALWVSDVNQYVKAVMENDALLSSISVRGEISNLKYHTSGHIYFTLKDENSELSAVMFRSYAQSLRFSAKNGMKVVAYGRVSVYEKSGKYQLYVSAMLDDGIGILQLEYERLFEKLKSEGIFDADQKKKLPQIPNCIGIITSPTGAAIRDIINVTGRRWPYAKIVLYPALVQGEDAPQTLCSGLEYLNADGECDVIIIGRGGGSIEDLWAFNDESVVRSIYASKIPVISAVGHETDFTLSDFVADCRAPTPSAAAELAVPDREEIRMRIDEVFSKTDSIFFKTLSDKKNKLFSQHEQMNALSPSGRLKADKQLLSQRAKLLEISFFQKIERKKGAFQKTLEILEANNPLSLLTRGYSMTENEEGSILSSVKTLKRDDNITVRLFDGSIKAKITEVKTTPKVRTRKDAKT